MEVIAKLLTCALKFFDCAPFNFLINASQEESFSLIHHTAKELR